MVPRVLEHVLLPSHWVRNRRYGQRKLGIGMDGKEVEMGMTEHPANSFEYPFNKGPFCGKNLVGMIELVRPENFLPWNIQYLAVRETEWRSV